MAKPERLPPFPLHNSAFAQKRKRNLQKSAKQGAFWCKMWYLIKVFKNKMRLCGAQGGKVL